MKKVFAALLAAVSLALPVNAQYVPPSGGGATNTGGYTPKYSTVQVSGNAATIPNGATFVQLAMNSNAYAITALPAAAGYVGVNLTIFTDNNGNNAGSQFVQLNPVGNDSFQGPPTQDWKHYNFGAGQSVTITADLNDHTKWDIVSGQITGNFGGWANVVGGGTNGCLNGVGRGLCSGGAITETASFGFGNGSGAAWEPMIFIDATSGNVTGTYTDNFSPPALGNFVMFRRIDGSANTVTINTANTGNITNLSGASVTSVTIPAHTTTMFYISNTGHLSQVL